MKKYLGAVAILTMSSLFLISCSNSTDTVETNAIKTNSGIDVQGVKSKESPLIKSDKDVPVEQAVGKALTSFVKSYDIKEFKKEQDDRTKVVKFVPVVDSKNLYVATYNKTPWYITYSAQSMSTLWFGDYAFNYDEKGIINSVGINIESFVKKSTQGKSPEEASKNMNSLLKSTNGRLVGQMPLPANSKEFTQYVGKPISDALYASKTK